MQGGYLDAEYDDFLLPNIPGVPTDGSDLDMRNTPEYTFGAGLGYVHSLGERIEMSYNVNYNWRDEYVTMFNNDPLGRVESAGFWNANIDMRYNEMITISVWGRNIGDERYYRAVQIPPISTFGQYNEPESLKGQVWLENVARRLLEWAAGRGLSPSKECEEVVLAQRGRDAEVRKLLAVPDDDDGESERSIAGSWHNRGA